MVFSSIPFLFFFLPITLILYYLVPFKLKNYILLLFSLIFYAWGEPIYVFLMIFSALIDYTNSRLIEKYNHKKKLFLIISLLVNLGLLGFFKYANFLVSNINNLLNINLSFLDLSLPIGISFYTFQTISYTIDVYRGNVKAEKNFFTYLTYISMFPQLIAGPIVRYQTVADELKNRTIDYKNYSSGLVRFLRGLFKKVLIANNIGVLYSTITQLPINEISVLTAWLGIIAFALQIYFDFSGYSDMAIGMGKMLGFNYLENFNYPYIASSITDFWRRWHISLSSWFKDYVYISLGGNRVKKIINIRNILIVWFLTGFWHGAEWNFIIWGSYYGVILILEKYVLKNIIEKLPKIVKHFYTIILVLIGWLIFAFDDLIVLKNYAKTMFLNPNFIDKTFFYYFISYFLIIIIGITFSLPIYDYIKEKVNKNNHKIIIGILVLIVYVVLFIISIAYLVSDTYNPFLYFRF